MRSTAADNVALPATTAAARPPSRLALHPHPPPAGHAPANQPAARYVAQWDVHTSKPACCPVCCPMGRPHQQTRLLPGMLPIGTAGQTDNTDTTCDRPLRRCVNLSRRRLLQSAFTDALHQLSRTDYRKLSLIVTVLLGSSLS